MKIIAIDPGKNFGYAMFDDGKLIASGDLDKLMKPKEGCKEPHKLELLYTFIAATSVLVVEDVVKGANTYPSWQAVWHTTGVQYLVSTIAEYHSRPIHTVSPQTLRSYISKLTETPFKKCNKATTIGYINDKYVLDLKKKDHNIADAIALGDYYLEVVYARTNDDSVDTEVA